MNRPWPANAELLTPYEVRRAFGVDRTTVVRWGRDGKLASVRTPGNHRRYYRAEVEALLSGRQRGTR